MAEHKDNSRQNLEKRVAIGSAGVGLVAIALGAGGLASVAFLTGIGSGGLYIADRAITSRNS